MESEESIRSRLKNPKKLEVVKQLGKGAFGSVALMMDPEDKNEYAVKTESITADVPQLSYEFKVYRYLRNIEGVPLAYMFWQSEGMSHMAMQCLGPSLEKFLQQITQWDVVNWIFPQSLRILEQLHKKDFLHRDIKPENLLTGLNGLKDRKVYLVDFGLCKRYRTSGAQHIPYKEGKRLTGTIRYASTHTHLGEEQSRRDDLQSLGYVMIYLIRKKLPWMNLGGTDKKDQTSKISYTKLHTTLEKLCEGMPAGFIQYFRDVNKLEFDQTPDYALLKNYLVPR